MIAGKRVKLCDDLRYFRHTDVFLLKNQSIMWTLEALVRRFLTSTVYLLLFVSSRFLRIREQCALLLHD